MKKRPVKKQFKGYEWFVFRHHGKVKESLTISEKKQKVKGFHFDKNVHLSKGLFLVDRSRWRRGEKHGKLSFDEELVGEEKNE